VARSGSTLTLSSYLAVGGVRGAVARLAETVWNGFDAVEQSAARRILLRLADAHSAGTDVRRRAARSELVDNATDEHVLATLIERRLLTASEDRVEVAHEALLREWPRLRGWLDDDREGRRLHRQLADAAIAWEEQGRDDADLYRGVRLHAARDWLGTHHDDANALELRFVAASEALDASSLRAARRTARRLRVLAVGLAIFLVAAVIGSVIAVDQRSTARRQALQADVNRLATSASTLSGEQHDLALLFGATAYELQPSDQDAGALQTALMNIPPGLDRIIRYPGTSTSPHLDAVGHLLAIPGAHGVLVDDVMTGKQVTTLSWPTPRQFAVFSGDDRFVAAGGSDGDIAVWDLATGEPSGTPLHAGSGTVHAVFDPHDDNRLYVVADDGALTAWDRSDVERPRKVAAFTGLSTFPAPGTAPDLTISADGSTIAAGGNDDLGAPVAAIWDTTTHAQLHDYPGTIGALGGDGSTLPFAHLGDTVLFNARTGQVTKTFPRTGDVGSSTMSPDGQRLAVAQAHGSTSSVTVYDVASGRPLWHPITLHSTVMSPLGFLPDGRLVTTTADEATMWTIGAELPPLGVPLDSRRDVADQENFPSIYPVFLPHMRDVLTLGGAVPRLHDPSTGRVVGALHFGGGGFVSSPDGRLILDGDGIIWDLRSGHRISRLPPPPAVDFTYVGYLSWSPIGDRVAADLEGSPYVWDVSDPKNPSSPQRIGDSSLGVIQDLGFMPDGRLLVLSQGSSKLSLIDVSTNRTVWVRTIKLVAGHHPSTGAPVPLGNIELRQFAPSPDGSTVALDVGGPQSGRITLLDLRTGAVKASMSEPTYGGVGYLNNGRWLLVTANTPGPTAQLYDATTLQPFGVPFPAGGVDQAPVAVDPAGTRFAQIIDSDVHTPAGYDPFLWTTDPGSWLKTACTIAGRNLTRAEWHQYLPDRSYRTTCPQFPAGS
jgi:WD40 repeat protein